MVTEKGGHGGGLRESGELCFNHIKLEWISRRSYQRNRSSAGLDARGRHLKYRARSVDHQQGDGG